VLPDLEPKEYNLLLNNCSKEKDGRGNALGVLHGNTPIELDRHRER